MSLIFARWQFTNRLRKTRQDKGITQKQAATIFDITERNWQKYESGDMFPTPEKLIEIADYFNISIDYLLGRSESPNINLAVYRELNTQYENAMQIIRESTIQLAQKALKIAQENLKNNFLLTSEQFKKIQEQFYIPTSQQFERVKKELEKLKAVAKPQKTPANETKQPPTQPK